MAKHRDDEDQQTDVSGTQVPDDKMPAQSPSIPGPTYENPNAPDADTEQAKQNDQRANQ